MSKIIKVAITADNHIGPSRFDHNKQSLEWMAEDIEENGCRLTLLGGDLFDKKCREEDLWLGSHFLSILNTQVLALMGNHGTERAMSVLANTQTGLGQLPKVVFLPSIVEIAGMTVYCLPHCDKANIQMATGVTGIVDAQATFNQSIDAILQYFKADSAIRTGLKIGLGHCTVQGSKTSTGQELYDPGLSHGFGVKLQQLAGMDLLFFALGHIHLQQTLCESPFPIFYPGSHSRMNYAETEEKGYKLAHIDAETGKLSQIEFRKNPHAPRLISLSFEWDGTDWNQVCDTDEDISGAEVRLIANYREGSFPNFAELQNAYEGECLRLDMTKKPITITKTRNAEVIQATNPKDQLLLYWKHAQESAPAEEEKAKVLALFDELMEETRNAI